MIFVYKSCLRNFSVPRDHKFFWTLTPPRQLTGWTLRGEGSQYPRTYCSHFPLVSSKCFKVLHFICRILTHLKFILWAVLDHNLDHFTLLLVAVGWLTCLPLTVLDPLSRVARRCAQVLLGPLLCPSGRAQGLLAPGESGYLVEQVPLLSAPFSNMAWLFSVLQYQYMKQQPTWSGAMRKHR